MQNIELNIDELVLNGFPVEQQDEIRGAFKSEITRLLAEKGVSRNHTTSVDAGVRGTGDSSARSIGIQAAQSAYGRIAR